ncbi:MULTISPECIES: hypothetical protein [Sphingomonas]|uniref:hypothetical protein n=1 Tax=Sphingomonas TaxID=13687 RepID=UPI00082B91D3|nr:hypothetical protein [Sphingomonas sp. CCH10-B3]
MPLSLSAYAATHGASRQAAAKWRDSGVLVLVGKLVDVEKSDAAMREHGLGRFKRDAATAAPQPRSATRNRNPAKRDIEAEVDEVVTDLTAAVADGEIDDEIAGGFIEELLRGEFRNKAGAVAVKENALALKHLLAAQKAAGLLIEIEVAERVLFDDRRKARDAWMNWPGRFGPLLAADLGIDSAQLVEALKPYVHEQLDELGEPDLDFDEREG